MWPWNGACEDPVDGNQLTTVQTLNTKAQGDNRVDTVRIGRGFLGGLVGVHYQIIKYVGLFAEFQVGGWFPTNSTVLFDLNVGPVITF